MSGRLRNMRSPARLARRAKSQRRHIRNHELMWGPGSWCEGRLDHQVAPDDRNPPVARLSREWLDAVFGRTS